MPFLILGSFGVLIAEPDDMPAVQALKQGLKAANAGTYGVGAVIVDSSGAVVCEGGNGVLVCALAESPSMQLAWSEVMVCFLVASGEWVSLRPSRRDGSA